MEVGKFTYGQENIKHISLRSGSIKIGNFCSIAENVKIYTGKGSHRKEYVSTYPFGFIHQDKFPSAEPQKLLCSDPANVIIGNDVWIGQNVCIMPGVVIGDGCIIANNSHVVKSTEPYSLVGGNPAKEIRKRFPEAQIEALLEIQWWNWDTAKINENLDLIMSADVQDFITEALKGKGS